MKKAIFLTAVLALPCTAINAFAGDMGGMKGGEHGAMHGQTAHKASGTVKSVDAAKGSVTIAHGPVASANWPGMTMAFGIDPKMLADVKPGAMVDFEFTAHGMSATISKLAMKK